MGGPFEMGNATREERQGRSKLRRTAMATSVTGAALLTSYLVTFRPRLRRWGATDAEVATPLPGDDIVPDATGGSTMATTRILPEWQHLAVGGRLPSVPDGSTWFEAASLTPGQELVLQASINLGTGRSYDPRGQRPRFFVDSTWSFFLDERPDGATRLLVRTRGTGRPRILQKLSDIVFWEPAHAIMQTRQFTGLRRRARSAGSASSAVAAVHSTRPVPYDGVPSKGDI